MFYLLFRLATFWLSWIVFHFIVVAGWTISVAMSAAAVDSSLVSATLIGVPWLIFAVHLGLYIWWRIGRRRRQYARDVAAAHYWNQVHADAGYR